VAGWCRGRLRCAPKSRRRSWQTPLRGRVPTCRNLDCLRRCSKAVSSLNYAHDGRLPIPITKYRTVNQAEETLDAMRYVRGNGTRVGEPPEICQRGTNRRLLVVSIADFSHPRWLRGSEHIHAPADRVCSMGRSKVITPGLRSASSPANISSVCRAHTTFGSEKEPARPTWRARKHAAPSRPPA